MDAAPLGQSWLERWDSLTLFTPRRFSALPGMPFPTGSGYPSRIDMARYLQSYAAHFQLPVRTGVAVQRLTRDAGRFLADTTEGPVSARQVVLATGPFRQPHLPPASRGLGPAVWRSIPPRTAPPPTSPPGRWSWWAAETPRRSWPWNSRTRIRSPSSARTHRGICPRPVLGVSIY